MSKILFLNDYAEGAHPRVLEALTATNLDSEMGYGEDRFCIEAAEMIRARIQAPGADVHFVSGWTQANLTVLGAMLRPYESVIAAGSAHINMHEAGAIEATGHKINAVPTTGGKLNPEQIRDVVASHTDEHMVRPRAVFVSQATEVGTIYSKAELEALAAVCKELGLYLYLDGARLGSGLAASDADLRIEDIARLVDVFYVGGTKNGLLLGEAIVLLNPALKKEFRFHIKQRGGLLAKGRVLGLQFREFFRDDLFLALATHANAMAGELSRGIAERGYSFLANSTTNQIFPILPNSLIFELEKKYGFYIWAKADATHSAIRLVTSWATKKEAVDAFLADLAALG